MLRLEFQESGSASYYGHALPRSHTTPSLQSLSCFPLLPLKLVASFSLIIIVTYTYMYNCMYVLVSPFVVYVYDFRAGHFV